MFARIPPLLVDFRVLCFQPACCKMNRGFKFLAPIVVEDSWAQCENEKCQKWRRLPPGTVVDDSQPW